MKQTPSPEFLRKLLRYEPDTGKLFWLPRTSDMFEGGGHTAEHSCARWNSRYAAKEAFTSVGRDGYRGGDISNRRFVAHRVAWAIYHGEWPSYHIDHINGDKGDNRAANLRDVSRSVNMRNAKMYSHNTSGHNGVYWHKRDKKWVAYIKLNGKQKHLGRFDGIEDAVAARKKAEMGHGFSQRHGT